MSNETIAPPLTVDEFAAKWKVSKATVWNWIAAGKLVARKIGPNTRRILAEDEAAWLAASSESNSQSDRNPQSAA